MDDDLKLVERLNDPGDHKRLCQGREYVCSCGWDAEVEAMLPKAAATIARLHGENERLARDYTEVRDKLDGLVKERDEAREGSARLEAAYGALSDDVFFAYPKITAMAKELSEAQAGEMRAIAREVYERLRAETAEAQRDAALEALTGLEPFLDAIICYASSINEHEPNRLAFNARAALASAKRGG